MVCLLTPCSRATSSVVRPASTCFSAAMICASVCLLLLIRPSPFLRPDRIPIWTDSGGQVSGKNRLAKRVIGIFPEHTTYVEALGGRAQALFHKEPSRRRGLDMRRPARLWTHGSGWTPLGRLAVDAS